MHCNCLKEKGKLAFAWSFSHTHTTQQIASAHPGLRSAPNLLCQEGFAHFRRVGPALLLAPPAARAQPCSPCRLPAPSQTARAWCPPLAAPTACALRPPNLPLQLTLARWETGAISPAQYTSFLQSSGALCALLSGCWGLIGVGGPGGPPELRTHPQP